MRKLMIYSFVMIIPILCFANLESEKEIDEMITHHIFSGDWRLADSLLEAQIKKHPESPKYYALKGQYYFYTRYYNGGVLRGDSLIQKMGEYSQKAIEVGEKDEMTLEDKFFVGTAYGFLSRFHIRSGSYWDTYKSASNCQNYLNEVLEEDPSFTDAKMGLAVIEYFTWRQMRGFLGFVAWVAGVYGNRDSAMMKFHDVADNGYWLKYEAQFALAALYRFIGLEYNPQQAFAMSTQLYETFPQNPWIVNQYNELRFLNLVEEKGVDFLETEFDSLGTKYNVTNPGLLNGFGYSLSYANRFDEAITVLKTNIKLFPEIANGYDSLSEIYLNAGNPEMAIYYSQRCLEKLQSDSTINDNFRELLRTANEERIESLGGDTGKVNI